MRKEFLEAGEIVGTHGVKGMLRLKPWSDDSGFLSGFKTVYLGKEKTPVKIIKAQSHGRITLMTLEGIESIEAAERLRGKTVFIKRDDAKLPKGRVFVSELIGCEVFDADNGDKLGVISDVSATGANDVWHIKNDKGEYLVPAIDDVIINIDVDSETVTIRPLKGIFDDEN